MKLMHGTSTRLIKKIEAGGLKSPDLTNRQEIAEFFAKEKANQMGGSPIILTVEVKDLGRLKVDKEMWRDPPWIVWDLHGLNDEGEWREKNDAGEIPRPKNEFDYAASLVGVFACSYKGVIPIGDVVAVEDVEVFEDD